MALKLRLGDGSVIQLERTDLRSWYERGLISDDTPAQRLGSSTWSRLADVEDVHQWRGRAKAPSRAAPPPADEYDDDDTDDALPSPWPRRLVLGTVAVLALAAVAFTSDVWLPAVQQWGASITGGGGGGTGTPAVRPAEDQVQRRHREAVQAATAELPHLRPDTIELVMASSAAGVLDAPEVFRRSYEAAGRGLAALNPTEARELGALNTALSGALSARERALLADYIERVRGKRPTSPAEDAEMSRLVRRGTAALSVARRARLQELFSKAVAAALGARPAAATVPVEPAPVPDAPASPAETR
jgi:hypothetical protein